ncbi:hypothetical protein Ndes2526B_g01234 [Nannochloris sp. 'desiccata']|nr:hypothetical protein NADE_008794 [Chlorella desiccata (nom. nud.)]
MDCPIASHSAKEERGSWGTNIHFPDSPHQELSDNDDPDFTDQPNKKKKYAYRKEVQRSYRQRVKNKKADVETALEETKRQWDAVAASNRYLQENEHALELLNIEGAHLLNTLTNVQAQRALAKNITALPADDPIQVVDSLLDTCFSGGKMLIEDQINLYASLPRTVLMKIEADFINRVDSLMAEWNVCYSSREKIERRLLNALQTRIRVALAFPLLNPEAHLNLLNDRVQPVSGTASSGAAKKLLLSVIEGLQLESKHKAVMINALKDYQGGVACLRAEMAMAQLALCVGPGAMGPFPDPEKGIVPGQMATRAERSISTSKSASILKQMPYRMVYQYVQLAAAVIEPLSGVQYAKLLLGCRPHLPDYIQLVELISTSE